MDLNKPEKSNTLNEYILEFNKYNLSMQLSYYSFTIPDYRYNVNRNKNNRNLFYLRLVNRIALQNRIQ